MLLILSVGLCSFVFILYSRHLITSNSQDKLYSNVKLIPENHVGLVLGCSRYVADGRENLYFRYRIQAASELYHQGKINKILVSGDNHHVNYDEPTDMKQALMELNVPEKDIVCDYAGFSTLDSVVRAKEVFQQTKLTIISQPFHNQRAIYIAQNKGIEAIGYNARNVHRSIGFKTNLREQFAKAKTVLDVTLLNRSPRFLGQPILISSAQPNAQNRLN